MIQKDIEAGLHAGHCPGLMQRTRRYGCVQDTALVYYKGTMAWLYDNKSSAAAEQRGNWYV
ncbi:MAG: hypothetical protein LUG99_12805 [Lachnospiraceae bacterium]|nr:hypothetical protein [Lachnospiraceae bacterium]